MHVQCAAAIFLLITVQLLISTVSAQDTPLVFKANQVWTFFTFPDRLLLFSMFGIEQKRHNICRNILNDVVFRFYAWAGKRSAPISDSVAYNKRKFYQWAGK
uniref:Secreted protein n=1 Tax=Ascaris lumbricoides TaxID=6252 RepID=A0A0M3HMN2_ASCLU